MLATWRQRLFRPPRTGSYPWVRWLHLVNALIFLFASITGWRFGDSLLYRIGLPLLTVVWGLLFVAESLPLGNVRLAGYLRLVALLLGLIGAMLMIVGGCLALIYFSG